MGRDQVFRATVYAMNTLLIKKGVYTSEEFEQLFCEHLVNFKRSFGQNGLSGCFFRSFSFQSLGSSSSVYIRKWRGPRSVRDFAPSTILLVGFRVHLPRPRLSGKHSIAWSPQKKRRDPPLGAAPSLCSAKKNYRANGR